MRAAVPGRHAVRRPARADGHAQVRLPALGEAAAEDFSVGTERTLGDQIMREIRRDPDYLDDPPLLEYVQGVWQPLLEAARQRGEITPETAQQLAWEVFLVRDRSVNAFALPGGFVGVHLGPDRRHRVQRRTGRGAGARAVARHAAAHRARHRQHAAHHAAQPGRA